MSCRLLLDIPHHVIIPCHPLFFILHHSPFLARIKPFWLSVIFLLNAVSHVLYSLSPSQLILYKSLLFIHCNLFPLSHVVPSLCPITPLTHFIPSSLSTIFSFSIMPYPLYLQSSFYPYPVIPSPLLPIFLPFYSPSSFPFVPLLYSLSHVFPSSLFSIIFPPYPISSTLLYPLSSTPFTSWHYSSLPTISFPPYPIPSSPFYPQSPLPFIPCRPLLFIPHHRSLLCHVMPSFLLPVTPPYAVLSLLLYCPLPLCPYPISSPLLYSPSSLLFILFHLLFIPHHHLPYPISFLRLHPHLSLYLFISCHTFFIPITLFIPCHPLIFITHHPFSLSHIIHSSFSFPIPLLYYLLFFTSNQPPPFMSFLYLIFPFRSPLRAPKILS